jgi:serine/threonine protein kinase
MQNLFAVGVEAFATQPTSAPRGWEPPTVEALQQALPQYEITALIARGGMGAVYKGTQKTLKRAVAIKVLPPEMEAGDMQYAERFKREAQSMAQLSHPNIVAVFDAGETPDRLLYFVMEFVEGTDVAQLIASEKRLEPQRAIQITTAVCEALAFAHEEGIIHRDIKPSNIMIDKRGRVKVADFGLAKSVNLESSLMTQSNMAMGTPDFIAPEALISGTLVDQRADIYAVGVMLYQMLTGKIPRGRFQLPSGLIPQIDPRLDAIVDKAMQTDRDHRYSTATEMKVDVESVGTRSAKDGSADTPVRTSSSGGEAAKKKEAGKSARAPLLLLATAAALILGTAVWFLMDEPTEAEGGSSVSSSSSLPASSDAALRVASGELSRSARLPVPASNASRSDAGGSKSPAPAFPPGQWVKVLTKPEDLPAELRKPDSGVKWEDGWLRFGVKPVRSIDLPAELQKNYAIRCRFKRDPATGHSAGLVLRSGTDGGGQSGFYSFDLTPKQELLIKRKQSGPQGDSYPTISTTKATDAELTKPEEVIEFGVVGDHLVARLGMSFVKLIIDPHLRQGKGYIAGGGASAVRDIEVINLDGLPEVDALRLLGVDEKGNDLRAASKTGALGPSALPAALEARAIKLWDSAAKVGKTSGVRWEDEAMRLDQAGPTTGPESRNAILRASIRNHPNNGSHVLALRKSEVPDAQARLSVSFARSKASLSTAAGGAVIGEWPLPRAYAADEWVRVELRAIGDDFTVLLEGQVIGTAHSKALSRPGKALLYGSNSNFFRDIVYIPLDDLSEAEARKVAGVEDEG